MIAISSDVHGEADTFEACLDHATSRGATEHWLLGDIVSGTQPDRSACLARQRCTVVVAGNHDMAVSRTGPSYIAHGEWDAVHGLELVERTRTALDVAQHAWLAGLPHQHVTDDVHCTHATAWSPIDFLETVDEVAAHSILADRRLAFVGHHHELFAWKWQDELIARPPLDTWLELDAARWVICVGSLVDDGTYALWDPARDRLSWQVVE